ncbi:MAG: hypothetical protein ACLQJ7_10710 [Syntrophobacteraceae bacterium]
MYTRQTEAGQWASFTPEANDVPTVSNPIANGNPDPIIIGTDIWIEPGTKTAFYKDVPVLASVVPPAVAGDGLDTHSAPPVAGFAASCITASAGRSGKYIQGYFPVGVPVISAGPPGPCGGTV